MQPLDEGWLDLEQSENETWSGNSLRGQRKFKGITEEEYGTCDVRGTQAPATLQGGRKPD
jgi:hypothetical protein